MNRFPLSRRRFVHGLATGGVMLGLSPLANSLRASESGAMAGAATGLAPVLSGTTFDLVVAELPVNFTGQPRLATTINGSFPAPTLRWREGDTVTIRVHNRLNETTSIHWHGILLPYQMDGVPGISFPGIAPGETFTYRFRVHQSGTYWYHSHSAMQELLGMYGAIIIEPRDGERIRADRDYVMQLSDWTDEDPMRIFHKLKTQSNLYNFNQPTAPELLRAISSAGLQTTLDERAMWNRMRMNPTDLSDLSAQVLTYLINGTTPTGNWTGLFNPGERIRLRCINGAGHTFYDVRIPGLKLKVVQADGADVEPVTVDEFRFGPGQTCDVLIEPKEDAYTFFAQSIDRSGFACGTFAARAGLSAEVPATDPVEWLSMGDMLGAMGSATGHQAMNHGSTATSRDHAAMGHGGTAMDHSAHSSSSNALAVPSPIVRHASSEYGPAVDMRVDTPRTNLDDPGVGLRNNGRRVLTLADLHSIGGPLDPREPEREIELHLTGNMERYAWSIDGLEFGQSTPVYMKQGERLRIILQNDTMMTHPMHLHGMWSELENAQGEFMARLHTIPVQPAQRISFLVTADAPGRWAWHCHLMFHMDAGMFREALIA